MVEKVCAVILAAGDGTRMKSTHPKVMAEVLFRPLIGWVTDNCLAAGIPVGCAVLGSGAQEVAAVLPESYTYVLQAERLGTGHAASMARDFVREGGFSHVAVLNGDAPLLGSEEITAALQLHLQNKNAATVISAQVQNPTGYGRVLREGTDVQAIVEDRDATRQQRAIDEINSGAYWFEAAFLLEYFENMSASNAQQEFYLTDSIAYAVAAGRRVGAHVADPHAVLGANTRAELAVLNEIARVQVLEKLMENGVNIPFLQNVVVGPQVQVAPDSTLLPGTILCGATTVGSECEIGPNSFVRDTVIGGGCRIIGSYLEGAVLERNIRVGPMSNIRPGCHIKQNVKIGDFVELKNSVVGERTSVAHLTYVGDSDVGSGCNFGCGVVTVNYDGNKKHRTVVGDDVFIGCNTNLVAPVTVGDRVYAAAGTTITDNVPADSLVIGRARQVIKENWVNERGRYKKK